MPTRWDKCNAGLNYKPGSLFQMNTEAFTSPVQVLETKLKSSAKPLNGDAISGSVGLTSLVRAAAENTFDPSTSRHVSPIPGELWGPREISGVFHARQHPASDAPMPEESARISGSTVGFEPVCPHHYELQHVKCCRFGDAPSR